MILELRSSTLNDTAPLFPFPLHESSAAEDADVLNLQF